jgi:hypothetical protein
VAKIATESQGTVYAAGQPNLDDDITALFSLDPRAEPAGDLAGSETDGNCTDDGCSHTCQTC